MIGGDHSPWLSLMAHNPGNARFFSGWYPFTHHCDKLVIQNEINGTEIRKELIASSFRFLDHPVHHLDPTLLCQNLKHGHNSLIKKGGRV